jgi:hypothetical protein
MSVMVFFSFFPARPQGWFHHSRLQFASHLFK